MENIVFQHWRDYGRNFYTRHDYEEVDTGRANALMDHLRAQVGKTDLAAFGGKILAKSDDFAYHDPVDQSDSKGQGIRFLFRDGSRIIYRLSGTGTAGATIRVYIERYEPDPAKQGGDTQTALADLIGVARNLAEIETRTGRGAPTVIT